MSYPTNPYHLKKNTTATQSERIILIIGESRRAGVGYDLDNFRLSKNWKTTIHCDKSNLQYADGRGDYRFGFNGQERENELNPSITSAEYWMYDGRLGRRWNVDPVVKYDQSGYSTFANNPILFMDPFGNDTTGSFTFPGADPNNRKADFSDLNKTPDLKGESILAEQYKVLGSVGEDLGQFLFKGSFEAGINSVENPSDGYKLLNHFLDGDGASLSFDANSEMSKIIGNNPKFVAFANAFESAAITHYNKFKNFDVFDATNVVGDNKPNYINGFDGEGRYSWTVMGGYKTITASIIKVTDKEISFVYRIEDHFGAGVKDSGSLLPGLKEMYYLQHYGKQKNYMPFKWGVTINRKTNLK